MKLKLFWRRSKTNWRRKLRPEGENIEIIQWNITTKFLSRIFTYQSLFILGHSYVSKFLPFCAAGDFFMRFRTFLSASHRPRIFEEVPTYHCSKKKANQQYEKIALYINQCWDALNLINVQFLTNAFVNYVWLTEK